MKLNELKPNARKKPTRKGQGNAAGKGTFAGRGCKGQNSRAGGGVRKGFEGGQTPLIQRMPKRRGFKNPNRVTVQVLNLSTLDTAYKAGETVDFKSLLDKRLIAKENQGVKILGDGELTKKLKIAEEIQMSQSAKKAIESSQKK
ncbi:50S ribosomal protein L15 [Candidatus Gracilibacteria bacterium]|nr:50S ribosomal protein L15 [Candidatus Gracilibacteria bacterium]